MTREELLEYAALDAFALLDEYEAALYTRSFHNAPAAVQDEIIQLQAQLVSDETLLPADDPDPALRERVLCAVAAAIETETAQLEPLATIGRPRAAAEVVPAPVSSGVSFYWRAAAFGLCAALIVVLYFLTQMSSQNYQIASIALTNNTEAQLEHLIGPTVKDYLFNPAAKSIAFKSSGTQGPKAVMYVLEDSDKAFLVFEGLAPTVQPYTLSMRGQSGDSTIVQKFESSGKLSGLHVALNRVASELKNVSWEISGPGGVVLASI